MAVQTVSCPVCGYPQSPPSIEGQTAICAYCGEKLEAISGVEIPTPIFAGGIGLLLGIFLGPAMLAGSEWGREYLVKKARGG